MQPLHLLHSIDVHVAVAAVMAAVANKGTLKSLKRGAQQERLFLFQSAFHLKRIFERHLRQLQSPFTQCDI